MVLFYIGNVEQLFSGIQGAQNEVCILTPSQVMPLRSQLRRKAAYTIKHLAPHEKITPSGYRALMANPPRAVPLILPWYRKRVNAVRTGVMNPVRFRPIPVRQYATAKQGYIRV